MQNSAQLDGDSATEKLEKEALGSVCSVYFAANFSYIVINTSEYFCTNLQKLMNIVYALPLHCLQLLGELALLDSQ